MWVVLNGNRRNSVLEGRCMVMSRETPIESHKHGILHKLDNGLIKVEEGILSAGIMLMAVFLIADIFSRNLLGISLFFVQEATQFLIYLITFMGISYAARKGRHIRMSALFDALPYRPQKLLSIFIPAVTAIILFTLAYLAIEYTLSVYQRGRVTPALEIPAYLMYIFVPIGLIFGGIQYVRNMWINIKEKEIYIGTERKGFTEPTQEDRKDTA